MIKITLLFLAIFVAAQAAISYPTYYSTQSVYNILLSLQPYNMTFDPATGKKLVYLKRNTTINVTTPSYMGAFAPKLDKLFKLTCEQIDKSANPGWFYRYNLYADIPDFIGYNPIGQMCFLRRDQLDLFVSSTDPITIHECVCIINIHKFMRYAYLMVLKPWTCGTILRNFTFNWLMKQPTYCIGYEELPGEEAELMAWKKTWPPAPAESVKLGPADV